MSREPATTRSQFADQIKVALTALVMLHHLAISFGAAGAWYFRDPAAPFSFGLSVLTSIDQAFFMGLFFFLAGYFTPESVDRKGAPPRVPPRSASPRPRPPTPGPAKAMP